MSKKPTGKLGTLKPKLTVNGPRHKWEAVTLPDVKDEIERFMMDRFVTSSPSLGIQYSNVLQNEENHFDFSAQTLAGPVYIDLMEAICHSKHGSPYQSEKNIVKVGQYALQILSKVMDKSSKYVSNESTPIHLLIYSTHWRFNLNDELTKLLKFRLMTHQHIFEKIFYIHPRDVSQNEIKQLYPSKSEEFLGFDPIRAEHMAYVPADMSNVRHNPDGTVTVSMDITDLFRPT